LQILSQWHSRCVTKKKGRGDFIQTLPNRIKVCQLNGYTTNQLIEQHAYMFKLLSFQFCYFKIQHRDKGLQGIISFLITFQKPIKHECDGSFVKTPTLWLTKSPFPSYPFIWKLNRKECGTRHCNICIP